MRKMSTRQVLNRQIMLVILWSSIIEEVEEGDNKSNKNHSICTPLLIVVNGSMSFDYIPFSTPFIHFHRSYTGYGGLLLEPYHEHFYTLSSANLKYFWIPNRIQVVSSKTRSSLTLSLFTVQTLSAFKVQKHCQTEGVPQYRVISNQISQLPYSRAEERWRGLPQQTPSCQFVIRSS